MPPQLQSNSQQFNLHSVSFFEKLTPVKYLAKKAIFSYATTIELGTTYVKEKMARANSAIANKQKNMYSNNSARAVV